MERDSLTPTDLELDASIAAVLDEFPLAPLPPGFVQATMQQITPAPRFQLQFLDLALPFLSGVLLITILAGLAWLTGLLNPGWLPDPAGLPQDIYSMTIQLPLNALVMITVAAGAALVMVATVSLALWQDRPLTVRPPMNGHAHGRT